MNTIEDNIESLSRAVLNEANSEAEQILAEARHKAEAIRRHAEEQAAAVRKEVLDRARREMDRQRNQSIASAQLKARTIQLEHREKLLNQVFTEAQKQLPNVQQWSNYEQIVADLLDEAVAHMHVKDLLVRADQSTSTIIAGETIKKISDERGIQAEIGEPLPEKIGVVVESTDGHLNYDNTLETRLNRLQSTLRSPVYHILSGESL